jgi:hypothetical protein
MANLERVSANIRITNEDRRSVCSINNVSPTVEAQTAVNFVNAIKTLYNNGQCSARMNVVYNIEA